MSKRNQIDLQDCFQYRLQKANIYIQYIHIYELKHWDYKKGWSLSNMCKSVGGRHARSSKSPKQNSPAWGQGFTPACKQIILNESGNRQRQIKTCQNKLQSHREKPGNTVHKKTHTTVHTVIDSSHLSRGRPKHEWGGPIRGFFFMMIAVYKSIKTILGGQTVKHKKMFGPCAHR